MTSCIIIATSIRAFITASYQRITNMPLLNNLWLDLEAWRSFYISSSGTSLDRGRCCSDTVICESFSRDLRSKHKTFVWHLYNAGPTSKTLGRRCTNVIQMFCVGWVVAAVVTALICSANPKSFLLEKWAVTACWFCTIYFDHNCCCLPFSCREYCHWLLMTVAKSSPRS